MEDMNKAERLIWKAAQDVISETMANEFKTENLYQAMRKNGEVSEEVARQVLSDTSSRIYGMKEIADALGLDGDAITKKAIELAK